MTFLIFEIKDDQQIVKKLIKSQQIDFRTSKKGSLSTVVGDL